MLDLDILTFENQWHQINHILNKNILFLRVFDLIEKFYSLNKEDLDKENQGIVRLHYRKVPQFSHCSIRICQKKNSTKTYS